MEEEEGEVMMMISSRSRSRSSRSCPEKIPDSNSSPSHDQPITSSNWKLYRNPFYNKQQPHHHRSNSTRFPHRPQRSLSSARKIAASFWDLSFFRSASMERPGKEDEAAAQIDELRAELERERRARRKLEYINKKLAKELAEERQGRGALERACEELAKEISWGKASIDRMKREMEEERRMLRMAEVLREERVQMKLAEAKVFLEEKMSQLEETNHTTTKEEVAEEEPKGLIITTVSTALTTPGEDFPVKPMKRLALMQRQSSLTEDNAVNNRTTIAVQRRPSLSPEPENPHIKRGIKGFVEFPRVVRAIGSKGRSWGSKKIEYQKAQIRFLLKQRSPVRSVNDSIIWGS